MFTTRTRKFATAIAAILTLSAPLTVLSTASFAEPSAHMQMLRDGARHDTKAPEARMRVAERGDHAREARFHKGDREHCNHHARRDHRDGRGENHERG
ncbi:MAG: hypothetical protein KGR48_00960 [Alphaproteobacteria bacterium]|nr:hypothetical protein [Alphaproteobacteria bacterium]MBU6472662.1 hypothetical protein [Alphaproteobacteria bacterium]MDE2072156.1 hypothetical protein [Alphaproteobacteria bacterium]MDE2353148.1 hypothetical protein [Alphaproteobacteria bacterium]